MVAVPLKPAFISNCDPVFYEFVQDTDRLSLSQTIVDCAVNGQSYRIFEVKK